MEIIHIILIHDSQITCKNCNNGVLITPVNNDGNWRCPKCNKEQQIVKINRKVLSAGEVVILSVQQLIE